MICAIQTFKVFLPSLIVLLCAVSWSSLSYVCPSNSFPLDLLCELKEGSDMTIDINSGKEADHEQKPKPKPKPSEGGEWAAHGRYILPFYGSGGEENGVVLTLDYRIADTSDINYLVQAGTEAAERGDYLVAADLLHCAVNSVDYMVDHGVEVEGVDVTDLMSTVHFNLAKIHTKVEEEGYCLYDRGPVSQGYLYLHDASISPAIHSLEKALSLAPSTAGWHQWLALLYSSPPPSLSGWDQELANHKAIEHFVYEIQIVTGLPPVEEWGRLVGEVEPFDTLTYSALLPFFNRLLNSFIKSARYNDVATTFDLLSTLQPGNAELCSRQSVWYYGKGNLRQGLLMTARDVTLQLRQSPEYDPRTGDRKSFIEPEVSSRMMVQLTSSFGNILVLMAKSLLVRGHWNQAVSMLNESCHTTAVTSKLLTTASAATAVKYTDLVAILLSCLESSNLVDDLIHVDGAWPNSTNAFGWQPIHHAVMIGSVHLLKALVGAGEGGGRANRNRNLVHAVTDSGLTPLHIAALYPSEASREMVSALVGEGVNMTAADLYGRTAASLSAAVGTCIEGLNSNCSVPVPVPIPRRDVFAVIKDFDGNEFQQLGADLTALGEWKGRPTWISYDGKDGALNCPIDVRVGLTLDDFSRHYLSVTRPVIIRRSNTDHDERQFQNLRLNMKRNPFLKKYGGVMVNHGSIPNGDAFQLRYSKSSLEDFMKVYLGRQYPPSVKTSYNDYVYQQLSPDDTLADLFSVPAVFNPEQSSLITLSSYLYIGGATSGLPVQFRRHSWNQLVYGESRWIIYPPSAAIYSTESIHSFIQGLSGTTTTDPEGWSGTLGGGGGEGHYDCIQQAGDIVFIPPGYSYGVMHTMESIGIASEFVFGADEFSI